MDSIKCYSCNGDVGSQSDAFNHSCVADWDIIYFYEGMIYPFSPTNENGEGERTVVGVSEEHTYSEGNRWMHKDILNLLVGYKKLIHLFRSPSHKNETVWRDLRILNHLEQFTYDQIQNKFKNLKKTYIIMKNSKGKSRSKWPYYKILEEIVENPGFDEEQKELEAMPNTSMDIPFDDETEIDEDMTEAQDGKLGWWTDAEIKRLIDAYKVCAERVRSSAEKKKIVYQDIRAIADLEKFSVEQVQNKVKNIKKTYMKIKKQLPPRKRRKRWPYYDSLDSLFEAEVLHREEVTEPGEDTRRCKEEENGTPLWFREYTKKVEKRHNEKMAVLNRMLMLMENLVAMNSPQRTVFSKLTRNRPIAPKPPTRIRIQTD